VTAAAEKDLGGEPVAWENPLIPNKKLRALYVAMVELRLLGEHFAQRKRRPVGHLEAVRGEEGCRVSTTFDLKAGDLTSDGAAGVATSFLRGAKLADVIRGENGAPGQLPVVAETTVRLHLAMGAAVVLKASRSTPKSVTPKSKGALLIAYVHRDELAVTEWKPLLRFAAEQVLPMIFVVLPGAAQKNAGQLSLVSSKCGVPGIPVDAADPVALFRVAQESMLRARAGGGPVLMECIPFHVAGKKAEPADPIRTMQEFLLHRKIVDEAWLQGVANKFAARLKAVVQQG
jgi:TPP-dependent pyruvate/acetoin dehydrogenase alpha subunit